MDIDGRVLTTDAPKRAESVDIVYPRGIQVRLHDVEAIGAV